MAFAEDHTEFFDTDDFAEAAIYTPEGGSNSTVNGIFDAAHVLLDGEMADISQQMPTFLCAAADVPNASHGDTLQVGGVNYIVTDVQEDGTQIGNNGQTLLILRDAT